MTKRYFRILIGFVIILVGLRAVKNIFEGQEFGVINELYYFPFAILFIGTLTALYLDTIYFKKTKKKSQYLSSFMGIILCGIVIFKFLQYSVISQTETVLKVTNLPGASNVLAFEFKTDGNFKLTEYNLFGKTEYYGKYVKSDDTLSIEKSNYKGEIKNFPKKGIIKNEKVNWINFDTMVINEK